MTLLQLFESRCKRRDMFFSLENWSMIATVRVLHPKKLFQLYSVHDFNIHALTSCARFAAFIKLASSPGKLRWLRVYYHWVWNRIFVWNSWVFFSFHKKNLLEHLLLVGNVFTAFFKKLNIQKKNHMCSVESNFKLGGLVLLCYTLLLVEKNLLHALSSIIYKPKIDHELVTWVSYTF